MTLRSVNELQGSKANISEFIEQEEEELIIEPNVTPPLVQEEEVPPVVPPTYVGSPPFPEALKRKSRPMQDKDVYETFRKCEVNIHLLDLLKSVPRYAKFLKELCTIKRNQKLKGDQKVQVNEHVSALFQHKLPPKCSDPGRQFFITSSTKIDVSNGSLTMEADGQVVKFNIYDSMKYPRDDHSCFSIVVFEPIVHDVFNFDGEDELQVTIDNSLVCDNLDFSMRTNLQEMVAALTEHEKLPIMPPFSKPIILTLPSKKLLPSVVHAPIVELKPLPSHLKYAFLGDGDTLPIIISRKLTKDQEERLLEVLKENKLAIGWTIADIKGISPTTCMHRILLEDNSKPVRQPQQRLNPPVMEVVKKEILKLLQVRMIYPISDSKWVSPTHVVPKKSGVTVVANQHGELVPTRVHNGWRVCVDYRRLNALTRKDHFPLPFIDQMLERLAGKAYYCFLDGYLGYFQIVIAPEDQDKTAFTCPFGTFAYRCMPFLLCNAPATFQRYMNKDVDFEFDLACKKGFGILKAKLTTAPIIQAPDWSIPFELTCDASDYALGAVLGQNVGRVLHVIYYASMTLSEAQRNYSTTEKEMLAVVFALEKFRSYLLGTNVLVKDKKGAENVVADHLSHLVDDVDRAIEPILGTFPDETLFALTFVSPWYANLVNFLVSNEFPTGFSKCQKEKIRSDAKYYEWPSSLASRGILSFQALKASVDTLKEEFNAWRRKDGDKFAKFDAWRKQTDDKLKALADVLLETRELVRSLTRVATSELNAATREEARAFMSLDPEDSSDP
ncbi:uncharacterized protein LOC141651382 [Silene latifolia]|uniref:uncharacterized protein LOC141651382 n=1 Tax=Silene latifolia TaxID=37657 RepID=UPI003D779B3B